MNEDLVELEKRRLLSIDQVRKVQERVSQLKKKIEIEFKKYKINKEAQNHALQIPKISRYYERFDPKKPNEKIIRKKYNNNQDLIKKIKPKTKDEHITLATSIVAEEVEALERELQLPFSVIIADNGNAYILDEGKSRLIGEGGAGKVKFAENPETNERVAVKIQELDVDSPAELKQQQEEETKIEKEVKLLKDQIKRKTNKNEKSIIKIYNVYEYLGKDLNYHMSSSARLKETGKIVKREPGDYIHDINEKIDVARKMMQQIQKMHEQGIVHRDLKADNVMYNRKTKSVRIIDYGISKKLSSGTDFIQLSRDEYAGTKTHMSPELRDPAPKTRTDNYSKITDLFSTGVTLMEIFGCSPNIVNFKVIYNIPPLDNPTTQDPNPKIQKAKQQAWKAIYKCIAEMVEKDKNAIEEIEKSIGEKIKIDPNTAIKSASDGYKKIMNIQSVLFKEIAMIRNANVKPTAPDVAQISPSSTAKPRPKIVIPLQLRRPKILAHQKPSQSMHPQPQVPQEMRFENTHAASSELNTLTYLTNMFIMKYHQKLSANNPKPGSIAEKQRDRLRVAATELMNIDGKYRELETKHGIRSTDLIGKHNEYKKVLSNLIHEKQGITFPKKASDFFFSCLEKLSNWFDKVKPISELEFKRDIEIIQKVSLPAFNKLRKERSKQHTEAQQEPPLEPQPPSSTPKHPK